jgi:dolichol-phosphate mannosyltransferase
MQKDFIIIPTYNESENIVNFVNKIFDTLPEIKVIIVDDRSPDGTGKIAENLKRSYPNQLEVLHRPGKQGIGPAYQAGFAYALRLGAQRLIQMDADFSHPIDKVHRMLELAKNYDLVIGSRYVPGGSTPGWGFIRRMISRGGGLYARKILALKVRDMTSGFKCFNSTVLKKINFQDFQMSGYGFQIELIANTIAHGFDYIEMPIQFIDRHYGQSKMSGRIAFEAMKNVWSIRKEIARIKTSKFHA